MKDKLFSKKFVKQINIKAIITLLKFFIIVNLTPKYLFFSEYINY